MVAIALGADHAGWELKEALKAWLIDHGHQVLDFGTHSPESVDYPDYAAQVAEAVAVGKVDRGVLVCGTGIGMAIAANKVPGVRAALCGDPFTARMSREHNDANVLVLGGRLIGAEMARTSSRSWLETAFAGDRHARRVDKIADIEQRHPEGRPVSRLEQVDPEIAKAIRAETERQARNLELIASENFVSEAVLEAVGSVLTNKYAEGYPGKRYYGGCEIVDVAEELAIARAQGALRRRARQRAAALGIAGEHGGVLHPAQAGRHRARPEPGARRPPDGGEPDELLGQLYKIVPYGVTKDTERIDMDQVRDLARQHRPKLIIAGGSAFPRAIEFKPFREIADEVGAALMADIAHPAGLVAAGLHPSPVPYADFVTTTTHKTLRGPRGGMVMCRAAYAKDLDRIVLPGIQGGPLMHVIAAKAVAFREAQTPEWRAYQGQIVKNAKALAEAMLARGFRLVSGGTDTHLLLVDLTPAASPARTRRRRSIAPGSP